MIMALNIFVYCLWAGDVAMMVYLGRLIAKDVRKRRKRRQDVQQAEQWAERCARVARRERYLLWYGEDWSE